MRSLGMGASSPRDVVRVVLETIDFSKLLQIFFFVDDRLMSYSFFSDEPVLLAGGLLVLHKSRLFRPPLLRLRSDDGNGSRWRRRRDGRPGRRQQQHL